MPGEIYYDRASGRPPAASDPTPLDLKKSSVRGRGKRTKILVEPPHSVEAAKTRPTTFVVPSFAPSSASRHCCTVRDLMH